MRSVGKSKYGKLLTKIPRANRITERRAIRMSSFFLLSPRASLLANEYGIAAPTMKRKNGNTKSVMVQPFQSACCKAAGYSSPDGFAKKIIRAIVMPLKTSRESSLPCKKDVDCTFILRSFPEIRAQKLLMRLPSLFVD